MKCHQQDQKRKYTKGFVANAMRFIIQNSIIQKNVQNATNQTKETIKD